MIPYKQSEMKEGGCAHGIINLFINSMPENLPFAFKSNESFSFRRVASRVLITRLPSQAKSMFDNGGRRDLCKHF